MSIPPSVWDGVGAIVCGMIAAALFFLVAASVHIVRSWSMVAKVLRGSVMVTAWVIMMRGIFLLTPGTILSEQHMPPFALMTFLSILSSVGILAYMVLSQTLRNRTGRNRFSWAFHPRRQPAPAASGDPKIDDLMNGPVATVYDKPPRDAR